MPSRDSKRNQYGNYNNYGYGNARGGGGPPRNHVIPAEPPFTAYIGNAPDSMVQGDFEKLLFVGLKVKQVRLVRDRQTDRFRGFAYVDFDDADSLRHAIELDGTSINDRPIRIDVAARPLGAAKTEGFRNKPGFESPDDRRQPSGNSNNRSNDGFHSRRQNSNNYNQQAASHHAGDGYEANGYNEERNRRSSGSGKTNERRHSQSQQHKTPPRKASDDEVFDAPDTPASNEDGHDGASADHGSSAIARQKSRNWADCPIDESVVEPSPPTSANNTFTSDDFQVVRNRNAKSYANQQSSSRPTGNQSARGRNNGNYPRGGAGGGGRSQMSGGHGYYDQPSGQYSQQYYHQQQQAPLPLHGGLSYHTNNNQRHQPSSGSRQRLDSNRSNNSRTYNDNNERSKTGNSESSHEVTDSSAVAENRPRLQLLPRSQKLSPSTTDDKQAAEPAARNPSIFGSGKPRDERDPKVVELNKHIEEVVEQEQHVPPIASSEPTNSVTKPVRILTAATESLAIQ